MALIIFTVVKEYFAQIQHHTVRAQILSQTTDDAVFIFRLSHYYKRMTELEANIPSSNFTSFSNAERHLIQYLEEMQNTVDLGGVIEESGKF